jgi:hypothetical protein
MASIHLGVIHLDLLLSLQAAFGFTPYLLKSIKSLVCQLHYECFFVIPLAIKMLPVFYMSGYNGKV